MKQPTKVYVYCRFKFEGFHYWPDAPDAVAFLRERHRHLFNVRAVLEVKHDDRDVEFILLKRSMLDTVLVLQAERADVQTWSCERWARELLEIHGLSACDVSEDGENGAVVAVASYTGTIPEPDGRRLPMPTAAETEQA